ncbi:hypothetical protein ACO0K0_02565 [Undibacterium sp. SXout11W]|uniref:hypothetical protein n=1 Tax=Undibacterium sp. SXout11W TaxID=3413050 RepID=UPI003BF3B0B8
MNHFYDQLEPFQTVSYKINGECLIGTFLGAKIDISNGQKMALVETSDNQTTAVPIDSILYQVAYLSGAMNPFNASCDNRRFTLINPS